FVAKEFGEKYGVLIGEGPLEGLLARAVFVIKDGKIAYKELVRASARESVARVAAGAVAAMLLREFGICVRSGVFGVGNFISNL
ncbi:chorismate synthase, partial [Campylobacter coli]